MLYCDYPFPPLTSPSLPLLLLLAQLVQRQVGHVQAVDGPRQHGRQGVHDARPLGHQLVPGREGGQHGQQLVPQLPRDEHAQVGSHPRHDDGLESGGERETLSERKAAVQMLVPLNCFFFVFLTLTIHIQIHFVIVI